jgi:hypothetical protein
VVFEPIRREIAGGRDRSGERLPAEAEPFRRFDVSRTTINRALIEGRGRTRSPARWTDSPPWWGAISRRSA